MKLNYNDISQGLFDQVGVMTPRYSMDQVQKETQENPIWLHFGISNIFRSYVAGLQENLLNLKEANRGIIAAETFDYEIVDRICKPYENLTLKVIMKADGTLEKQIVGSVCEAIKADLKDRLAYERLVKIAQSDSLQLLSMTITEKGYRIEDQENQLLPVIEEDAANGLSKPKHVMSVITALLYYRYLAGEKPIACVSMDNCSHNGDKLKYGISRIADLWYKNGFVTSGFLNYLKDSNKVTYPLTMIDKITPRPSEIVGNQLSSLGIEQMNPLITKMNTYMAPFVNAEYCEYLVIEDQFPNGRPPLEKVGVYFTDREIVDKVEKMKVTTCLNPLHTSLAIFGCLLTYNSIADEMKDELLKALVERIGYQEGLPVVVHPGIIDPKDFLKEVLEERLPNPYIPDMPQRIATDTSLKIPIRFGETLYAYNNHSHLKIEELVGIPLTIAGWFRYLLGRNDLLEPMEISPDPMVKELQKHLEGIIIGEPDSYKGQLKTILDNTEIFKVNLLKTPLEDKIEEMFIQMLTGKGAIRETLVRYL